MKKKNFNCTMNIMMNVCFSIIIKYIICNMKFVTITINIT